MFLSDVSIRRPVFATMLNLVLIVFGLFSLPKLAVDQYPKVDFPVVSVSVVYPGADPAAVEQKILDPLEKAVNGISGLDKMASTGYPNLGIVTLQFKLEKNADQAAQEVRDKVFAAVSQLPTDAQTPVVQKFDIAGAPILNVALSGKNIAIGKLSQLAKDVVQTSLERVPGVARVDMAGYREREVHIHVDRKRLAAYGLTPADVMSTVSAQDVGVPTGKVQNDTQYWTVRVEDQVSRAEQLAALPIAIPGGGTVRLADIADVQDTVADEDTAAFKDQDPTIVLAVYKQSDGNTTSIADDTIARISQIKRQLPAGANLEVVSDNSKYIKGSIDSVKLDLLLGAVLATFIVLVFLRDLRATLISAIALPTAVIATFAFLQYMGFTLNMMTTLGLSLSIGILIDDAIVVIENIYRHLQMGKKPMQAARDAADEIGLAVLATTLTVCAVFVPVAFMDGMIGRFFYQFGLTVAFAVLVSLFVAFTLTPMLSARLLKEHHGAPKSKLLFTAWNAVETSLIKLEAFYKRVLGWCLEHRKTTLGIGFLTFVISIVMLRFVPVSFFPKEDRSLFEVSYELPEGTPIEVTKHKALELVQKIKTYPGVGTIVTAIGADQTKKPNVARIDVNLVDKEERTYTQEQFMNRMRTDLQSYAKRDNAEMAVVDVGGSGGGAHSQRIQLIYTSHDWDHLVAFTDKVAEHLRKDVPGTVDVTTTKPKAQREFLLKVDPVRAADVGLTAAQVAATMRNLFEGDKVGELEDETGRWDVRLRIADGDRVGPQDIAGVMLTNRKGQQINLASVAQIIDTTAPAAVDRFDGQRQITVLSNFTGKDLNKVISDAQTYTAKNAPPDVTMTLSGEADMMKQAIASMLKALGLAILLVYMVLCAQYERYAAPLVIMAALPLSLTGAFGAMLIGGSTMSVFAMIGIILLMGIVTKNGILLVDFAMQRLREGQPLKEALTEAGVTRLRPILMTTLAAGFGMVPIALGHGVGGESRSPMGVCVIGGLIASTVLTLVVVPCFFVIMEGWRTKFSRKTGRLKIPKIAAGL